MQEEYTMRINSFQNGVNEYSAEGLLKPYEAYKAVNCDITNGSLKSFKVPSVYKSIGGSLHSLVPYYSNSSKTLLCGVGTEFRKDSTNMYKISGRRLDSLNFEYNGKRIVVCSSSEDTPFIYDNSSVRPLKNRRKSYDKEGNLDGYYDANGTKYETEASITTFAPTGDFCELHYDRLWIAGNKDNPDRVYFSTANVNGADIEDFTSPTEEAEANQHGGFLDVRSYDGGKIIGLKVVFNAIVIFKNKTAYKIFGSSPDNYQLVQLFSSNGAIADKSICVGSNGAYFLNNDGIYFYDGTNTNLISQKISNTIKKMNLSYTQNAVGYFYNNKYYLAIPTGTSTTNNTLIEFNPETKAFTTFEVGNIGMFVDYDDKLLYTDGSNVRSVFDGTTSLPMYWETPMQDFGAKNTRKMGNYIYFRGKGNGNVKITCKTDRKTKSIEVPLTDTETLFRKKLKNKGRLVKLIFENVNSSNIEVTGIEYNCEIDVD